MEPKDDGGPAFPVPAFIDTSNGTLPDGDLVIEAEPGMTLRDYFAAHAPTMQNLKQSQSEELIGEPFPDDLAAQLVWSAKGRIPVAVHLRRRNAQTTKGAVMVAGIKEYESCGCATMLDKRGVLHFWPCSTEHSAIVHEKIAAVGLPTFKAEDMQRESGQQRPLTFDELSQAVLNKGK